MSPYHMFKSACMRASRDPRVGTTRLTLSHAPERQPYFREKSRNDSRVLNVSTNGQRRVEIYDCRSEDRGHGMRSLMSRGGGGLIRWYLSVSRRGLNLGCATDRGGAGTAVRSHLSFAAVGICVHQALEKQAAPSPPVPYRACLRLSNTTARVSPPLRPHRRPTWPRPLTASTRCTSSTSARNAMPCDVTAACRSRSVATTARTASSRCPARAFARRRTGEHVRS